MTDQFILKSNHKASYAFIIDTLNNFGIKYAIRQNNYGSRFFEFNIEEDMNLALLSLGDYLCEEKWLHLA